MPVNRSPSAPPIVIENARAYTSGSPDDPLAAFSIYGGHIQVCGSLRDVLAAAGPGARHIDAGGRAVIPGLIDAHIHVFEYSRSLNRIDLDGVRSRAEVLAIVADRVKVTPPGRWILGGGWNNHTWSPPDFPTRQDLDAVAPDNPVYLDRKDLHSCWVNTAALRRAGITCDTPDPPASAIGRDAEGEPDGMFYEAAVHLVRDAIDEPPEEMCAVLKRGFASLASMGLTGLHVPEGPEVFAALQEMEAAGELPLRVVILLTYNGLDDAIRTGLRTGFGSDRLRVGPVKIFSDGSLGSVTAEMLEPYEGMPGKRGIATVPQQELEEAIVRAAKAGIPSAVHAIGDAANRRVLDAFAKVREVEVANHLPHLIHRIEHAQIVDPADVPRFAALDVVASMQPIHATSDMHAADRLWGQRARYSYGWRSLRDAGAMLAFGSDAPVETPNPFAGIHAAVTRQDASGDPPGGWYPRERLTLEEALHAYTAGAARSAHYLPGVTGLLSHGSVADFVILDNDIFSVEVAQIREIRPVATVVGGEAIYDPTGLFEPGS